MAQSTALREPAPDVRPWPALFALCLGFFMILVDTTIVTVATPAIISDLHADVNSVVWVTSAYLLAYAVPVLITGRLGDRFGPKNLYLVGLTVFTLASLWCGLTTSIEMLIAARVLQGLGAGILTPQTMSVITRIFPADKRGQAMALWGATAGVATLVGPILGGILVDALGWQWIFFINIPVGVVGFVLAVRWVPRLDIRMHKFDWLGVALSGVGMFLLVFGIQQGHKYHWNAWVMASIVGGLVVFEDPFTLSQRDESVALASRLRLPAIYGYREFAGAGGLLSYGTDHAAQWRRGAEIVDMILRGAKPADIPVEQPTKFELVVNLKTAKASNFTVPETIMVSADEVIE